MTAIPHLQAPRAVRDEAGYFGVEEKLLLHWQEIKRRDWFDMPKNGVQPDGAWRAVIASLYAAR